MDLKQEQFKIQRQLHLDHKEDKHIWVCNSSYFDLQDAREINQNAKSKHVASKQLQYFLLAWMKTQ